MRLVDLFPRWLNADVFTFLCPCCWQVLLTVKRVPMPRHEQWALFDAVFGENYAHIIVGTREQAAWTMNGDDFERMTVTPSLDASASGHWHGFITDGHIVGGQVKS